MKKLFRHYLSWLTASVLVCLPMFGQQMPGKLTGSVVDVTGAPIMGAKIRLSAPDHSPARETESDSGGQFVFQNPPVGELDLIVTAKGFAEQHLLGTVRAGENLSFPQVVLELAHVTTGVEVSDKQTELAQEQIKLEEEQRLLGVLPNYEVSYIPIAAPLDAKQKFELVWKTVFDPVSFGITGLVAGAEQYHNSYKAYGQGTEGYAKRFGASYSDFFLRSMISRALLPSLFKEDPRYFVKGSGSAGSRMWYAAANAFIGKGDDGRWRPRYSEILGNLAASGISNVYYPAADRHGAGLTFEDAGIGLGARAIANLFQEFASRKLTPKKHH
jgi:hypothetical protein